MYVLGCDHVMDMPFNDPDAPIPLTYGDVFKQTEEEYARWNFDVANTERVLQHFEEPKQNATHLEQTCDDPKPANASSWRTRPMINASRPATCSTCWTRAG